MNLVVHFDGVSHLYLVFEDEVGDDREDATHFCLNYGLPAIDDDACVITQLPMIRKNTK